MVRLDTTETLKMAGARKLMKDSPYSCERGRADVVQGKAAPRTAAFGFCEPISLPEAPNCMRWRESLRLAFRKNADARSWVRTQARFIPSIFSKTVATRVVAKDAP